MRRVVVLGVALFVLVACSGTASAGLIGPGPGLLPKIPLITTITGGLTAPAPAPSPAPAPAPLPAPAPVPGSAPAPAPAPAPVTAPSSGSGLVKGLIGGGCGVSLPVFAAWGDRATYYFAPNGGFEAGAANWSLGGGAGVVAQGNEPWYLAGGGSHALQLPKGGSASTVVCYGLTYPAVRFFVAGVRGNATIHVRVIARNLLGVLSTLDGGKFTVGSSWAPSPKISTLFSAVTAPLGTKSMQLQFTVESGTAQIDDLFVDPLLLKS
jgi:hypothetical protein